MAVVILSGVFGVSLLAPKADSPCRFMGLERCRVGQAKIADRPKVGRCRVGQAKSSWTGQKLEDVGLDPPSHYRRLFARVALSHCSRAFAHPIRLYFFVSQASETCASIYRTRKASVLGINVAMSAPSSSLVSCLLQDVVGEGCPPINTETNDSMTGCRPNPMGEPADREWSGRASKVDVSCRVSSI